MKLAIRIALVIDVSVSLALPAHGLPSDTSSGTDLRHLFTHFTVVTTRK